MTSFERIGFAKASSSDHWTMKKHEKSGSKGSCQNVNPHGGALSLPNVLVLRRRPALCPSVLWVGFQFLQSTSRYVTFTLLFKYLYAKITLIVEF